jgi:NADH:ubiquinone oxidoreductase subunit 2 (subunit N)
MISTEAPEAAPPVARGFELRLGLAIAAILTIAIGIFPSTLITLAEAAAKALL